MGSSRSGQRFATGTITLHLSKSTSLRTRLGSSGNSPDTTVSVGSIPPVNLSKVVVKSRGVTSTWDRETVSNMMFGLVITATFGRRRDVVTSKHLVTNQNENVCDSRFSITHGSVGADITRSDVRFLFTSPLFAFGGDNENSLEGVHSELVCLGITNLLEPSLGDSEGDSQIVCGSDFNRHGQRVRTVIHIVHVNQTPFIPDEFTVFVVLSCFASSQVEESGLTKRNFIRWLRDTCW